MCLILGDILIKQASFKPIVYFILTSLLQLGFGIIYDLPHSLSSFFGYIEIWTVKIISYVQVKINWIVIIVELFFLKHKSSESVIQEKATVIEFCVFNTLIITDLQ